MKDYVRQAVVTEAVGEGWTLKMLKETTEPDKKIMLGEVLERITRIYDRLKSKASDTLPPRPEMELVCPVGTELVVACFELMYLESLLQTRKTPGKKNSDVRDSVGVRFSANVVHSPAEICFVKPNKY